MDLNFCFLRSVDGLPESVGYHALVKTYFGKFANYIDVLLFNLANRLVPRSQWARLCVDSFNFCSELTDDQRKITLEKLMEEKCGPVPLLNDEKNRIHAEYVTLLVNVEKLCQTLHLQQSKFGTNY